MPLAFSGGGVERFLVLGFMGAVGDSRRLVSRFKSFSSILRRRAAWTASVDTHWVLVAVAQDH